MSDSDPKSPLPPAADRADPSGEGEGDEGALAATSGDGAAGEVEAKAPAELRASTPPAAVDAAEPPSASVVQVGPVVPVGPESGPPVAWPSWTPAALALGVPALLFFLLPPLTKSGLWDPYELNVADLARRVALNLLNATSLALDGADNTLPHLNDLGRPQLPFTSIAVGFKLFGLHEWSGRLPLALWGLAGVGAAYAFVARLFDRRTGVYTSVALSTMPLYFVQARAMIGDVCAMAALAMAFGGLAVAVFDRDEAGATPPLTRLPWLAMGAAGLFVGLESRGALLGVAVPLVGVGAAWAVARLGAYARERDVVGDVLGAVILGAGVAVGAIAVRFVTSSEDSKDLSLWVGAMLHAPSKYPTFDFLVGSLGHALAPWSAFVPFALGRMLMAPVGRTGTAAEREGLARTAVLVGLSVAVVAHGFLASHIEPIAFTAPVLCAVACAVAIRDFERGASSSIAVGLGTLLLAATLHHDFHEMPEKAFQAFGVNGATFPESFKDQALELWWVALGGFALCAFITWIERDAERAPFDPTTYARLLKSLREAYDGMLALVYFAAIAGASLAGAAVFASMRWHLNFMPQMSSNIRDLVLNAWWVIAVLPLAAIFGLVFAADVWLWAFGRSRPLSRASVSRGFEPFEELLARLGAARKSGVDRYEWGVMFGVLAPLMMLLFPAIGFGVGFAMGLKPYQAALLAVPSGVAAFLGLGIIGDALRHRAAGLALGGLVVGVVLCVSYYPALANQVSPKEVFESYRSLCPGAPFALLGVGGRTAAYYAGGQPQTFNDTTTAFNWMTAGGDQRRCLALKADELPKLNQLWRERMPPGPRTNLPVLDARSSQIVLAASTLGSSDKNENPLGTMVLQGPPKPQRPLDVDMDDKLQVLGIDIVDEHGRKVDAIAAGRTYHLKTYYKVLAPITTEWEAFIHIDGYHRRHNGDHKVMNGKYPMSLWLVGDLVMDDHEFKLEPNFSPGTYTIYFGLFVGDNRLKVKSGPNDGDNRIDGGALRVQ